MATSPSPPKRPRRVAYIACPACGYRWEKDRRNGWPDTPAPELYEFTCGECGWAGPADEWHRFRGKKGLAGYPTTTP